MLIIKRQLEEKTQPLLITRTTRTLSIFLILILPLSLSVCVCYIRSTPFLYAFFFPCSFILIFPRFFLPSYRHIRIFFFTFTLSKVKKYIPAQQLSCRRLMKRFMDSWKRLRIHF